MSALNIIQSKKYITCIGIIHPFFYERLMQDIRYIQSWRAKGKGRDGISRRELKIGSLMYKVIAM